MTKYENILALIVLTISTIIKIWSLVALYTIYAHTEELSHDLEFKTAIKKTKFSTHQPLD